MSGLSKPVGSTQILAYTSGTDPFEQAHTYLTHLKEVARQPVETPATLKGRAIVLVGASSAGKSTIIHSLRTLDKEMLEEGADLTGAHFIYEFMNQNYHRYGVSKSDWEHLHNVLVPRSDQFHIHDAVSGNLYQFRPDASPEDHIRAKQTGDKLRGPVLKFAELTGPSSMDVAIHHALDITQKDGSVAFDTLNIEDVMSHPYSQQTQLTSVFVFCPFNKLTERLAERNRKALSGETGLNEKRIGTFPFTQYATLVRPKKPTDSEDQVIDHVTKKQAIAAYHSNSNKDEIPQEEFLTAFGFDPADPEDRMISFVPRKTYDMIVDTSDPKFGSTPAERGDAIAKAILS